VTGEVVRLRRPERGTDPPLSDEAIARACAGGDATAIAKLFDRFQKPVTRYVHRLTGGGPDLEDLVQSTFLEVARGATAYDGRAGVLTWLFAVATNVVRHHRRSAARRYRLLSAVAAAAPADRWALDAQADARAQLARAQEALASLSDDLREAFVLCDLEGLSARDAARVLDVSEAAAWKRVSRAREAIRRFATGGER